ncbi:TPA: glycosyltransferase family 4 protein [Escherichia albertii]|uniref:Predicted glycosyltransferase, group I family n=1 Tax=Escherichia albertii TaxID=208962 RepID=A0A5A4U4D0_ESCAL|nr:glycosyltransferase family 1 protein [Escherichia albertii]BBM62519.1 predicted glycosyltransferase, group I family [Escherichia albertii]
MGKNNIGIDGYWMTGQFRGMGRFAWQLVASLRKECIAFYPKKRTDSGDLKCIELIYSPFPIWEQIQLPFAIKKNKIDVMIYPYNTGPLIKFEKKRVIVIHDLIFFKNNKELPHSASIYQNIGRYYRRLMTGLNIKKADVIITVSEFTKLEICSTFNINPNNIIVIPNALSDHWYGIEENSSVCNENYIFTVAGDAPSKNLKRLLSAFSKLVKDNTTLRLKIAGVKRSKHKYYSDICQELDIINNVDFLGYISIDELKGLYKNAKGFIFASLFEGFGIPLIEAMASRIPIAYSKSTSLPEIANGYGICFDPYSIQEIYEALLILTTKDAYPMNDIQRAYEHSLQYKRNVVDSKVIQTFAKFYQFDDGIK